MRTDLLRLRRWNLGDAACKIFSGISLLNLYGSVYFLSIMSIDRYIAVCHPIQGIWLQQEKTIFLGVLFTPIWAFYIIIYIWLYSSFWKSYVSLKKARKIRTKTYGWLLALIAWLFSLGLSSQGQYHNYEKGWIVFIELLKDIFIEGGNFKNNLVAIFLRTKMIYKYDPVKYCRIAKNGTLNSTDCELFSSETVQYSRCVWDFSSRLMSKIFLIGRMVTGFLLPILIIAVSYAFIWRTAANLQ